MTDQNGPYVYGPSLPPTEHPVIQAAGIDVADIRTLSEEAGAHGDHEMVMVCTVALGEYDPDDEEIFADLHEFAAGHNRKSAVEECRRVLQEPA